MVSTLDGFDDAILDLDLALVLQLVEGVLERVFEVAEIVAGYVQLLLHLVAELLEVDGLVFPGILDDGHDGPGGVGQADVAAAAAAAGIVAATAGIAAAAATATVVLGVLLPGAVLVGVDGAAVSLLGLDDLVVDVIKDVQHPAKMMGELFGERRRCTAGRCCCCCCVAATATLAQERPSLCDGGGDVLVTIIGSSTGEANHRRRAAKREERIASHTKRVRAVHTSTGHRVWHDTFVD